jgi:biopolymer transport protein ExbD
VMLVLLIMLIITIPIQLHTINLDVPAAASPAAQKPTVIKVDVDAQNTVRWNGQVVNDRANLQTLLHDAAARTPQPEIHVRAQAKAKYEAVAAVLAGAQREGLQKIGILGTEQFNAP